MALFRLLIIVAAVGAVAAALAWMWTGRRFWLTVAANILKAVLAAALIFFAVLIFERLG